MQELSMNNYKEMRDKTADEDFYFKKLKNGSLKNTQINGCLYIPWLLLVLKRYSKALELGVFKIR